MSLVYGHLSVPARQVYELLVDHPGPDTAAAPLAAALDLSVPEVAGALQLLHTARLVDRWPGDRYHLAEGVRQHATHLRDRTQPSIRAHQRGRLIDWYAATAAAAVPLIAPRAHRFSPPVAHEGAAHAHADERQARIWFSWEHHVLRRVAATAAGWGWDDVVVELADAVWHLARPTYHHDDLTHIQHAGHTAAQRSHPTIAAVFRAREAAALSDLSRHHVALAAAADATAAADDTGDPRLVALAYSLSGRVQLAAGRAEEASQELHAALRAQRRLAGDPHGHAVLHRRIGQAYLARGGVHDAIRHLRDSREEMTRARNPLGAARAAASLAEALVAAGRPGEAMAELSDARARIGRTAAVRYLARLDLATARTAYHLGDTGIARRLTDTLITQLAHAGPGAAADLYAARELHNQL
jgi:tetratricopeptide (TPR) repeat protein